MPEPMITLANVSRRFAKRLDAAARIASALSYCDTICW